MQGKTQRIKFMHKIDRTVLVLNQNYNSSRKLAKNGIRTRIDFPGEARQTLGHLASKLVPTCLTGMLFTFEISLSKLNLLK